MEYKELCSPQSESGIIATLIYNPKFILTSESLTREHFNNSDSGKIYWAIKKLTEDGIYQIDAFNICSALSSIDAKREGLKEITAEQSKELLDVYRYVARETIEEYTRLVKIVQEMAFRRNMYNQLQKAMNVCLRADNTDGMIQSEVYDMVEEVNKKYSYTQTLRLFPEKMDQIYEDIERRQNGDYMSIPFPFPTLNQYVQMEPGELVLFGAYAKVGKSAMLLTILVDLLKRDKTVLLIDSELSDRLFSMRLIAHVSGVDFKKVKDGTTDEKEIEEIKKAKEWIKTRKFYHEYLPILNDSELMMTVKRANTLNKLDALIIDYFKNTNSGNAYDVSNAMARTVDMVKNDICGTMNIPAIGAVQTTATGEVALSSGIIRNCSTLVTLVRKSDSEILSDGKEFGNTKAKVKINRNGAQHSDDEYIDFDFKGNILKYIENKTQHNPEDGKPY